MANRILIPEAMPSLDLNANLENGSTLTFLDADTLLPKSVYSDITMATPLGNVITSINGYFPEVWAAKSAVYQVEWRHPDGSLRKTFENVVVHDGVDAQEVIDALGGVSGAQQSLNIVGNTYVDASNWSTDSANNVSPSKSDNTVALQACIDANQGKTIVIPPFYGQQLNFAGTAYLDKIGTNIEISGTKLVRPSGVYVQNAIISISKRVAGGAQLQNVGVTGKNGALFYFEPVATTTFTATAGQTVFSWDTSSFGSVGLRSKFDFVIFRTRAGVTTFLSASSDISAGSATGFTLAAASTAGDFLEVALVPANASTGAVSVYGTSTDLISATIGGYDVEGCCYVANQLSYYDKMRVLPIRTYGCIDRGGIYPYLGGNVLIADAIECYGKARTGFGAGRSMCSYGININDLTSDTAPFGTIKLNHLHCEDISGHSLGYGGNIEKLVVDGLTSKNAGFYDILGYGGAIQPLEVVINGYEGSGSGAQPVYILGSNTTINGIIRNAKEAARIDGGARNTINLTIIDTVTTASGSASIFNQTDSDVKIKVSGGPNTGVNALALTRGEYNFSCRKVSGDSTYNAGDGILVNNVQDAQIKCASTGYNRGSVVYGNSSNNVIDVKLVANATTGLELGAGSNTNSIGGVTRGHTNNLINSGTSNNVAALISV